LNSSFITYKCSKCKTVLCIRFLVQHEVSVEMSVSLVVFFVRDCTSGMTVRAWPSLWSH